MQSAGLRTFPTAPITSTHRSRWKSCFPSWKKGFWKSRADLPQKRKKKIHFHYAVDELVAQYKQDKNESVFAEIMEKTKGLIYVFARSYSRSIIGAELEDLVSEGDLVLWDAIQTFDDTRECSFTTYLCGCLKRNYNTLFSMESLRGALNSFSEVVE